LSESKQTLFQRLSTWLKSDQSPSEDEQVKSRVRSAVESLLENEALTEGLDAQSASILLDWARANARTLAQRGGEDMEDRLRSLRLLMRSINRWVSSQPLAAHSDQHPVLGDILEHASIVYGCKIPDDRAIMLAAIQKSTGPSPEPARFIQGLLNWLDQSVTKD
jgi:hypothetical protein